MIEAGGLITAKEAERRVLILENPGLRGQSKITTDLYAGVQLVLPGEVAPGPPARAKRAPLRPRGRRRAHRRRRRTDDHARRRLHHHAADGVARSRQRERHADLLARRPRHPDRAVPRRVVRRAPRRRRAAGLAAGRRLARRGSDRTCCRSTTRRRPARRRSSTTRTPAREKRSSACGGPAAGIPATGSRCATRIRSPAAIR